MKHDLKKQFLEYLKKPWFACIVLFVPIFVALLIPSISADLIIIVSAFVISDLVANSIVRGGKGIGQITVTGTTQSQPEGYVLIAFFISILVTSIVVTFISETIASFAAGLCSDLSMALVIAFVVDFAVYADMRVRFYWRSKTKQ